MATAVSAVRIKEQALLFDLFDRDYVPDVDRNKIRDKNVDFLGGVLALLLIAASSMQVVATFAVVASGLDLHTPQALAGIEDEVVAFAIAPGFGDSEAEAGGFVKESEFGDFAAAFRPRGVRAPWLFSCRAGHPRWLDGRARSWPGLWQFDSACAGTTAIKELGLLTLLEFPFEA
jgi:hypothetical protein